jgi:adenosine deaminase
VEHTAGQAEALIRALPKVELHVHLEGSVRPTTFLRLARRNGLDVGSLDEHGVVELFRFRDVAHVADLYRRCAYALREPADFELVVIELGLAAHRQNVRYVEATFAPALHVRVGGIPFDEQLDAVARGAAEVHRQTGIRMRFVLEFERHRPARECAQVAEWAVAGRDRGVVALGVGDAPSGRPATAAPAARSTSPAALRGGRPLDLAEPIGWAAANGIPLVPHVGEPAEPAGVREWLRFDPPRIANGVPAVDDPALAALLHERGVLLEVCATADARTGAVPDLAAHPLRRLWDAGVPLTLNSDHPSLLGTDVLAEYRLAAAGHGFTVPELAAMTLMGVDAALLPAAERRELRDGVLAELTTLEVIPVAITSQ